MDQARQTEVLRAIVKEDLRKSGLRFDRNDILREIGQEEKNINAHNVLSRPLIRVESLELYLEIMRELVAEHFALIEGKITELKNQDEPGKSDHEE
jgi:hypothetical protein